MKGFKSLCNPVLTALHPAVHQVGYKTTVARTSPPQAKFMKSDHTAVDQFGTHSLTLVKPIELRAPSAKVLGAGGTGTVNTTGVDHFECYKAVRQKGTPKFVATTVTLIDQFGSNELALKKITKLCAPVNKNGEDPTAPQHPGHLVCYRAKLPKGVKFPATTVSVNNTNFGPAVLVAKSVAELCVPALKDPAPTATPAATPTATPVPTPTATPMPTSTLRPGGPPFQCGPISCSQGTQICCSPSPAQGTCCDFFSQQCSPSLTSCETVVCSSGETYIPLSGHCCSNETVCGIDCCDPFFEFCDQPLGIGSEVCRPRSELP